MRKVSAAIGIVLLLVIAGGITAVDRWHGPIVLSLSAGHGIHIGDIPALLFIVLVLALARDRLGSPLPGLSWRAPALALGVLLLLAGVVIKAGGGPLVPAVGGTFDGTIRDTSGTRPVEVEKWSAVAATFDGAELRLYVNGREVASSRTAGALQTPANPLWIGGNRPYGEHFEGLIDEVRVYNRALKPAELRRDMATPVAPAPGLVAAYGFDARVGATAADASGKGNSGRIVAAKWARGRFGGALSFDGVAAVVRVPPSASLDLTRAMTLSGWIRPSASQTGWRTVVQRQTDAYFLTASSDQLNRFGLVDNVRVGLLLAAAAWFCLAITTGRAARDTSRRRRWWLPVALFVVGALVDAGFAPAASLVGPMLVALWLAVSSAGVVEVTGFLLAAGVFAGLTVASLAHSAAVVALERDEGAIARSAALGVLLLIAVLAARRAAVTRR